MGVNDVLHLAVCRGDHMPRIDKRIRLFGLTTGGSLYLQTGEKGKEYHGQALTPLGVVWK